MHAIRNATSYTIGLYKSADHAAAEIKIRIEKLTTRLYTVAGPVESEHMWVWTADVWVSYIQFSGAQRRSESCPWAGSGQVEYYIFMEIILNLPTK